MEELSRNDIYNKLGKLEGLMEEMHETHVENKLNIMKTLEQTLKTNGRVTNLESIVVSQNKINSNLDDLIKRCDKRLEEQERRHSYSMGVLKVLGIIGGVVMVFGGHFLNLSIREITRNGIHEALSDYEVIIQK
jgi:hypothetical protein